MLPRGTEEDDHDDEDDDNNDDNDGTPCRSLRNEKFHPAVSANRALREQHCAASTSARLRDVRWSAKSLPDGAKEKKMIGSLVS